MITISNKKNSVTSNTRMETESLVRIAHASLTMIPSRSPTDEKHDFLSRCMVCPSARNSKLRNT